MDLAINSMAMTMQDHHGGLISPLDATENGTYAADGLTVDGYSPVNVAVEGRDLGFIDNEDYVGQVSIIS